MPQIALPRFVADISGVVSEAAGRVESPRHGGADGDMRVIVFGHLGDGNLHVNVTGVLDRTGGGNETAERVEAAVLRLVVGHHGSISAEHGIGTAKRAYLSLQRSPAELAAFAAIRRAFDPDGICNPHVLVVPTP